MSLNNILIVNFSFISKRVILLLTILLFIISSVGLLSNIQIDFFNQSIYLSIFSGFLGLLSGTLIARLFSRKKEKIFLSYSKDLEQLAIKIEDQLESNRFNVIRAEEVLIPGDNIKNRISNAIINSDRVIVLLDKNSKKSDLVNQEIVQALKNGKRLIPILTEDNSRFLPKRISNLKFEVINQGNKKDIDLLIEKLNKEETF